MTQTTNATDANTNKKRRFVLVLFFVLAAALAVIVLLLNMKPAETTPLATTLPPISSPVGAAPPQANTVSFWICPRNPAYGGGSHYLANDAVSQQEATRFHCSQETAPAPVKEDGTTERFLSHAELENLYLPYTEWSADTLYRFPGSSPANWWICPPQEPGSLVTYLYPDNLAENGVDPVALGCSYYFDPQTM